MALTCYTDDFQRDRQWQMKVIQNLVLPIGNGTVRSQKTFGKNTK